MKKLIYITLFSIFTVTLISCGAYSFTGGSTGDAKTLQVDFFPNQAALVEPTLSQTFTNVVNHDPCTYRLSKTVRLAACLLTVLNIAQ